MTAAVVVYILIVTLPLLAAAALMEKVCRLWSWPVRGAWALTALLIVLICGRTVVQQMIAPPAISVVTSVRTTQSLRPVALNPSARIIAAVNELISFPRTAAANVAHAIGPAQSRILAMLWCLTSAVLLALICAVYIRVWHARRTWKVTEFAGHRVRVAPSAGPAVIGLFHPEIVVPHWLLESLPDDRRLIVMHETEHCNARDPLLLAAMWLLVALMPWNPGAWYCLARTRLAIELDCDARVVGRGASLRTYAQLLVNQARARLGTPLHFWLGATSLLEPTSHLERRLNAMILPNEPALARRPVARYVRTLSYLAVVSTIAIAACESHVPTAADISGLDVASAEKNARNASVFDGQPVAYYADDFKISVDSAHAISAADISSITINKVNKSGPQEVRITTRPHLLSDNPTDTLAPPRNPGKTFTVRIVKGAAQPGQAAIGGKDRKPFSGAVVIDGVASDLTAMKAIDPARIASIEVIKGPAALATSTDPRAVDGIIMITLKH